MPVPDREARMADSVPLDVGALEAIGRRDVLVRQQHELFDALTAPNKDARALASISKELREITRELDSMPDPGKVTALDRLRADRAARRATTHEAMGSTGTGH